MIVFGHRLTRIFTDTCDRLICVDEGIGVAKYSDLRTAPQCLSAIKFKMKLSFK